MVVAEDPLRLGAANSVASYIYVYAMSIYQNLCDVCTRCVHMHIYFQKILKMMRWARDKEALCARPVKDSDISKRGPAKIQS